ncbi:maestro heat-like repeat-containing protein family member 2B [Coturnix japonica]|uniref:maestro heat-like repeat-containing protein family member 2B n=1 Tax=Coturnix japonica TaxID=93934 RepID=UPI0013A5BFA3|nr:maestro heat-like repeat-containing protein family member 2B [Coturnix japonica]
MWAAEIPLLLQCLEGKDESVPDSAEWENRLLKFLRASLETMEDEAWTEALSCELSRWLSSSPSSSGEKVGSPWLYPAGQLQVPNWGCGWCSAHVGCSHCFPSPCPPESLSMQSPQGLAKA